MKIHFFTEDTHLPQEISKCITCQQSLDHSYCKRETLLTKSKNSKSVMILVVTEIIQLTDIKVTPFIFKV
jgi:hypothetical protein